MSSKEEADNPPSYLHHTDISSPPYTQHAFPQSQIRMNDPIKPTLQPWLGLRARMFLSPISVALISLLLVASRLIMSSSDIDDSVSSAKTKLLSSCTAVEHTASLAASFPHFLAGTTNAQLAKSVTATVHGAGRVFDLSITAIEKILIYIVDSYKSLFLCFMELLVRGSLAVLMEAVQLINQAVTAAAQGIRAAIQESVEGINALLSTAVGGINDVVGVFGQHVTPPHIAVPNLAALENITLPHEIQDGLIKLNATLPTLQQLKQTMNTLIQTPFEQMRVEVNETLAGFRFNETVFPIPQMDNVTFCDRIDTRPLDEFGEELRKVARWGLVLLGLLALIVILLCLLKEWWCWKREVKGVEGTRAVWLAQNAPSQRGLDEKDPQYTDAKEDVLKTDNLMSLIAISRHPLISSLTLALCTRVGIRTRRAQDRISWLLSFLSHPASLACLFTGLLGLLSVALQTFFIHRLTHHYSSYIDTSLTHLTNDILDLINSQSLNASHTFASSANSVITQVETELNTHVLSWVETTTSTMNATLNEFLDGITDALTSTFGGTPFNAPLQTFVQCVVGQKVRGIEKALTWIHDNAHVDFDLVTEDVLVLKGAQEQAVLHPIRTALMGKDGEEDGGLVGHVVGKYLKHLQQEKVMFLVLIAIYGFIMVVGMVVVLYATIRDRRSARRGGAGGGENGEEMEEKLRDGLQAAPSRSWWPGRKGSTLGRFGRVSPFTAPSELKDVGSAPNRSSIAGSNRSNRSRGHVKKDSISYPFPCTSNNASARPRQPTPLRNLTLASSARDTTLSLQPSPPTEVVAAEPRSSWLSFLASMSSGSQVSPKKEKEEDEDPDAKFERLFGCSPVTSPTTPSFGQHLSLLPGVRGQMEEAKDEDKPAEGGSKYRETLDLLPMQGWIGSKSPVPPPPTHSTDSGEEVKLMRSSKLSDRKEADGDHESFAFDNAQARQHQQRIASTQSISFYAW